MIKTAAIATVGACAFAGIAQAETYRPPHYVPPPRHTHYVPPPRSHYTPPCRVRPNTEGYNAVGTLVSWSATRSGKSRVSGTVVVNVTRTNHGAPTGQQTFTLVKVRVVRAHGVTIAVGDIVGLHGTITVKPRKCNQGFVPTIVIRDVGVKSPAQHYAPPRSYVRTSQVGAIRPDPTAVGSGRLPFAPDTFRSTGSARSQPPPGELDAVAR